MSEIRGSSLYRDKAKLTVVEEIYEFHYAILLVSDFQQSKFVEHLVNPVDEFRFVGVRSESKVTKLVFIKNLKNLSFSSSVGLYRSVISANLSRMTSR